MCLKAHPHTLTHSRENVRAYRCNFCRGWKHCFASTHRDLRDRRKKDMRRARISGLLSEKVWTRHARAWLEAYQRSICACACMSEPARVHHTDTCTFASEFICRYYVDSREERGFGGHIVTHYFHPGELRLQGISRACCVTPKARGRAHMLLCSVYDLAVLAHEIVPHGCTFNVNSQPSLIVLHDCNFTVNSQSLSPPHTYKYRSSTGSQPRAGPTKSDSHFC